MKRFLPFLLALSLISSVPVATAQNIDQLFQEGNAAQDAGNFIEAERIFRKAIQITPQDSAAYNNLGNALKGQEKLEEAITVYRKAIQLKPDDADTYHNLGIVLRKQQKYDEAIAAYRKAIQLKPDDAETYVGLGNVLNDQKKLEEAIAAYNKAIQLKPDYATAYYNLGIVLYDQQKLDEAIAAYHKAIQLKPDYVAAYNNLGNALYRQQKLDEAITALKKAIQLKRDSAFAYINLGFILNNQQKLEEAINTFKEALTFPDEIGTSTTAHTVAHNALGRIFQEQGNLEAAIDEFQKALAIDPQFATSRNNLKEVQRLIALRQQQVATNDIRYLPSIKDEPLVKELRSTTRIISEISEGSSIGAGWVVKREGDSIWIVTNRHVISDQKSNRISNTIGVEFFAELPPKVSRARYLATIINSSKPEDEIDLAVLKVTGVPKDIQPLLMQPGRISRNTIVKIIGHPFNIDIPWSSSTGEVMNFSAQNPILPIGNTTLAEGNSGGPVLNSQNQLIGMIFGIRNEGDYSPATSIQDIIKEPSPATGKVGLAYRIDIVMAKLREWNILNSTQP